MNTKTKHLMMDCLTTLGFSLFATTVAANTYYVDSIAGNDNAPTNTISTPWKSLSKINAILTTSALPGDNILLKCGSVWNEALVVSRYGNVSSPINISAYGSCSSATFPIIQASQAITGWQNDHGDVWKATLNTDIAQVIYNSAAMPMARLPKIGTDPSTSPDMFRAKGGIACTYKDANIDFTSKSCGLIQRPDANLPANDLTGADIIIRSANFYFDHRRIVKYDAATGTIIWRNESNLTPGIFNALINPTYSIQNGFGYYLAGKAFMISQAGEWAVETSNGQRTLFMQFPTGIIPNNSSVRVTTYRAPTSASDVTPVGVIGINASKSQYVNISNIRVQDATFGVEISNTSSVTLDALAVERSALVGIRAYNASKPVIQNTLISQSGFRGIDATWGKSALIQHNRILNTGTHLPPNSDTLSNAAKGTYPYSAITCDTCDNVNITGNLVKSSPQTAITIGQDPATLNRSRLDGNFVVDSCVFLDDCGALYTGGRNGKPNQLDFVNNVVRGSKGSPIGRAFYIDAKGKDNPGASDAVGIYLDDYSKAVNVSGNTVSDADYGLQPHNARDNTITNNTFFANRRYDVWFQEDQNGSYIPANQSSRICPSLGNCIVNNQVASNLFYGLPGNTNYFLDARYGETRDFATFSGNKYALLFTNIIAKDKELFSGQSTVTSTNIRADQWQNILKNDLDGSLLPKHMAFSVGRSKSLGNLISNGDFTTHNVTGWSSWSSGKGQHIDWTSDLNESFARFTSSSASSSLLYYPLTLEAGSTYAVRFALRTTSTNAFNVDTAMLYADGSKTISPTFTVAVDGQWREFYQMLKVSESASARLNLYVPQGYSLDMDDVRVVKVSETSVNAAGLSHLFTGGELQADGTDGPTQFNCPEAGTANESLCNFYINVATGATVIWPEIVVKGKSEVLVAIDPLYADADSDGVADSDDQCTNTPYGTNSDELGCSYDQRRGH